MTTTTLLRKECVAVFTLAHSASCGNKDTYWALFIKQVRFFFFFESIVASGFLYCSAAEPVLTSQMHIVRMGLSEFKIPITLCDKVLLFSVERVLIILDMACSML